MHGKFLFTVILSVTMASFFIPGIAHDNFASSQPQAITNSAGKPASSEPKTSFQVYIPLLSQQPVTEVAVDQPVEITPTPEPTAESEKQPIKLDMDMNFHSQRWETSVKNACGPTSLLMVLDYFGEGKPLPTIIKSFKVAPDKGGFDPSCKQNPVCLSAAVLEEMARGTFKLAVEAHEDWTFDQVYQALQNGQPVIADVTWRLVAGGTGHFVVIYGLDPQSKTVYYHDPFDGASQTASWDQFSASWNGPVDAGDPLQPDGHRMWGMALAN